MAIQVTSCSVRKSQLRPRSVLPRQGLRRAARRPSCSTVAELGGKESHLSSGRHGNEPIEHFTSTSRALEEREASDSGGDEEGDPGNSVAVDLGDELGCVAVEGESVKNTRAVESEGGSGRVDGGEDTGVDDVREDGNLKASHGGDVGGASSAGESTLDGRDENGIVVGNEDADGEGGEDEEDDEAVEDGLEGGGHDATRVDGLSSNL